MKTREWTLKDFEKEVRQLDPNVEPDSDIFKTAVLMLAALQVGQDVRKLARFTGYPLAFVTGRAGNLKASGVWRRGKTACEWFNEGGAFSFWLDVATAEGLLQRSAEAA